MTEEQTFIDDKEAELMKKEKQLDSIIETVEQYRKRRFSTPFWRPFKKMYFRIQEELHVTSIYEIDGIEEVIDYKREKEMKEQLGGDLLEMLDGKNLG